MDENDSLVLLEVVSKGLFPSSVCVCGSVAAKFLVTIDFNGDTPPPTKMGTEPMCILTLPQTQTLPQTLKGNGP